MTHHDVIIFKKLKLKKNPKTNNCKKNFEILLNPSKDINITRFTCLRFAREVSPPYIEPIFMGHSNVLESVETIGKRLEFGKATMEPKSRGSTGCHAIQQLVDPRITFHLVKEMENGTMFQKMDDGILDIPIVFTNCKQAF